MRKIIVLFFIILGSITLKSQSSENPTNIYQDFGTWSYNIDNHNMISVKGYVIRERIIHHENKTVKEKTIPSLPRYRYELKMVSFSIHDDNKTSTWLYGARVYINGQEVTREQFPDGFLVSVKTKPTLIYWYESTENNVNFKISWDTSLHEPRNIK